MAKTTYRTHLRKETVQLKKYFYALRPLFAIRWLEKYGTPAPIEFSQVMSLIDENELLDAIHQLLEKKKVSEEQMLAPVVPVLNKYIESELSRLETIKMPQSAKGLEMVPLNNLFQQVLYESN